MKFIGHILRELDRDAPRLLSPPSDLALGTPPPSGCVQGTFRKAEKLGKTDWPLGDDVMDSADCKKPLLKFLFTYASLTLFYSLLSFPKLTYDF